MKKVRIFRAWFSHFTDSGRINCHFSLWTLSPSSGASESDSQLSSPRRVHRCGILCSPVFSCAPLPVSPLPCLYSDTVWLVLWLVTVLQGPCQMFVLREAGLAIFRSLTVPLVSSVPSCCYRLTLRCLFSLALRHWLRLLLHLPSFYHVSHPPFF